MAASMRSVSSQAWPAIGWGIGLAFHIAGTVADRVSGGRRSEEEEARRYMERHPQM